MQHLYILWLRWKRSHRRRVPLGEFQYLLDAEAVELRDEQMLDLLAFQQRALVHDDITQMPNCMVFVIVQITIEFARYEAKKLVFRIGHRRHGLSVYLYQALLRVGYAISCCHRCLVRKF